MKRKLEVMLHFLHHSSSEKFIMNVFHKNVLTGIEEIEEIQLPDEDLWQVRCPYEWIHEHGHQHSGISGQESGSGLQKSFKKKKSLEDCPLLP